jgi:glutamine synthetase
LDGIEKGLTPPPSTEANIFKMSAAERAERGITSLPGDLEEALECMKADPLVREVLGDHVFERFVEAKEQEWDEYRMRVTPWELEAYLSRY